MGILGNGRYDRAHVEESTVRLSKRGGGERKKDETETRRAAAVASGACMRVRRSSVMGVGVRRGAAITALPRMCRRRFGRANDNPSTKHTQLSYANAPIANAWQSCLIT